MAEILPSALAAFDARKMAMVKQLAELLSRKTAGGKMEQMLASIAEDTRALPRGQEAAMSVMPEVAAQGRGEVLRHGMDVAGMFIGPNAKLSKIERQRHADAQMMEAQGSPLETIRQRTGWDKDSDGNWRMEISDKGTQMSPQWRGAVPGQTMTGLEAMEHPNLYGYYPHMQGMPVKARAAPGAGSYSPKTGITVGMGGSPDLERSVLLHEFQHGVANTENWARGGSPNSPEALEYAARQVIKDQTKYRLEHGVDMPTDEFNRAWEHHATEGYKRMSGEINPQNTEIRRDYSDADRYHIPPLETQPYKGQIIPQTSNPFADSPIVAQSIGDPVAAAKAQLAPYQHQVFDRLYASTKDIATSLAKTKSLTDLMKPPSVVDLIGGGR